MVQARLPDINTEFITYRREALVSLQSRDYTRMFTALYAVNALLPPKYQVKISTIDYLQKSQSEVFAECNNCKETYYEEDKERPLKRATRVIYKTIKLETKLLPAFEASLSGKESYKVWKCPICKKENVLSKTKLGQQVKKKPYFLQVVPEPPERKEGIMDRNAYHKKMSQWFGNFVGELAFQESKFREEYVPKGMDLEHDEIEGGEETEE